MPTTNESSSSRRRSEYSRTDEKGENRHRERERDKKPPTVSSHHSREVRHSEQKKDAHSARRTSPPHRGATERDRPGREREGRRGQAEVEKPREREIRKSTSDHGSREKPLAERDRRPVDKERDKTASRRVDAGREVFKRPRSRSPPKRQPIRGGEREEAGRRMRRDNPSPVRKTERREEKIQPGDDFATAGFGASGFGDTSGFSNSGFGAQQSGGDDDGFGNSGFANTGFNTGFSKSNFGGSGFNSNNNNFGGGRGRDNQGKPRILAPNGGSGENIGSREAGTGGGFKLIVNELSAESIKRDEHPMKGQRATRRAAMRGGFKNVGSRGNFVGAGRGGNIFGGTMRGPTSGFGMRGGFNTGRDAHPRDREAAHPEGRRFVASGERNVRDAPPSGDEEKPPVLNPLAVPKGRNYFLHDHRDSAAMGNFRMYDPRVDRGSPRGRFMRARGGGGRGAPMGWRNFGNTDEPSHGGFSRGGGFAGSDSSAPSWRSKADEDLVWKHDKFMEVTQEEVDTKLELLDEVEGDQPKEPPQEEEQEDWAYGQPEKRERYQPAQLDEDEEYLEYETAEELVMYD